MSKDNAEKLAKIKSYLSIITPLVLILAGYLVFRTTAQAHMQNESVHLSEVQMINIAKVSEIHEMLSEVKDIVLSNERGLGLVELEFVYMKETQERVLKKLEKLE